MNARHTSCTVFLGVALCLLSIGCMSTRYANSSTKGALDLYGKTVAVLPFDSYADRELGDTLARSVQESLIQGVDTLKVVTVERGQLDKLFGEMRLGLSGLVSPATRQKAGRLLGAEVLVVGSVQQFGDSTRITARFIETESGITGATALVTGASSEVFELIDELARLLAAAAE